MIVRILAFAVPKLPRRFWYFLADVFGAIASVVHRSGRRVAFSNLEAALGSQVSVGRRKRLVRESYQYFARGMADLYWSPRLTMKSFSKIVDFEDLERLKRERGTERGYIFAGPHYGGFEWIALALGLCGFNSTIVTQAFKNPLLDETFNRLRETSGVETIRRDGALLRLYKALLKGRSIGMAVDLTVSARLPAVPIECFGLTTCVTMGHAWMHERTGAPIIPINCEPRPGGRYRLTVYPPIEMARGATHQEIAQACWDRFEPVIRENPAPWLWMYKYWRYRPAAATRRYPDYANESPHFEKLLARTAKENAERRAQPAAR